MAGRRHDSFLFNESGMLRLMHLLTVNGVDYKIYGDSAYPVTRWMAGPVARRNVRRGTPAAALNECMAGSRR